MSSQARRSIGLVIAVFVVVVAVLVVRDPGVRGDSPEASRGSASATASPAPGTETSELVTYDEFCAAFFRMVDAHSARVANATPETKVAVVAAGEELLEVGAEIAVSDAVGAGLEAFARGVMEEPATATAAEQQEFSTFLTTACPPTP